MQILKEKKEVVYKTDIDISKVEEKLLLKHYKENCPKSVKKNLKLEWAIVNLLENYIKEQDNIREI
jgi:hypothetical protein